MTITQPDTVVSTNTAILFINGGSNPGSYNLLAAEALTAGLTVVNLPTIPNQPLQFSGEASPRSEDEIIAKTLANFLDGSDYVTENVFDRFDTPLGQDLLAIVDPYEYRDRLDMPNSTASL